MTPRSWWLVLPVPGYKVFCVHHDIFHYVFHRDTVSGYPLYEFECTGEFLEEYGILVFKFCLDACLACERPLYGKPPMIRITLAFSRSASATEASAHLLFDRRTFVCPISAMLYWNFVCERAFLGCVNQYEIGSCPICRYVYGSRACKQIDYCDIQLLACICLTSRYQGLSFSVCSLLSLLLLGLW